MRSVKCKNATYLGLSGVRFGFLKELEVLSPKVVNVLCSLPFALGR